MVKLIEPTTPPLQSCFARSIAPGLRSLHICSSHRPCQANLSSPHLTKRHLGGSQRGTTTIQHTTHHVPTIPRRRGLMSLAISRAP